MQIGEQPSPAVVLPSSHCSEASTVPFPQVALPSSRQAAEQGLGTGRLVKVEGLRIELGRKGDQFVPRDRVGRELKFLPDRKIVEIAHARNLEAGGSHVETVRC